MTEQETTQGLTLDQKTIDVLVAHIIPTSKYFEVRFDHVQQQIDRVNTDLQDFRKDVNGRLDSIKVDMDGRFDSMTKNVDKRFDSMTKNVDGRFDSMTKNVDKRFEQVDKRFEQVDKRFEQMDKRFEQIDVKLDKLLERIDIKIDAGLRENRAISIRLFSFAIMFSVISVVGMFGKLFKLF